jgi:MFS family permease
MGTDTPPPGQDSTMAPDNTWRAVVRGNVLMMGLVSLFTDFSSEMIYPLLPVFISGLARPEEAALWVGLMEGIAESTASVLKIFSGRISDAVGRRKLLVILGYGISSVARPLMAVALLAWHVVGLRFLDRIGKGIRTSPRDALIGDSVGPDVRGLAFSFHRAMDHLGAVLGPLAAAAILYRLLGRVLWHGSTDQATGQEMRALRVLFAVALIPGMAAMASLVFKVREIAPPRRAAAKPGPLTGWRELPGRFYGYVGIVTLFALGNSSDLFLLLYGWHLFNMGLATILALWVVLHLSKIFFSFPGGVLSDKLGRRPIIIAGWLVYALVYLGMARVQAAWQFWALFIAYGGFYGLTEGAQSALVADFIPSGRRGAAFGVFHGAVGLAALPASLLFGVFWKVIGPRWAFGIGAALAGAAAILLALLLSATPRKGSVPT